MMPPILCVLQASYRSSNSQRPSGERRTRCVHRRCTGSITVPACLLYLVERKIGPRKNVKVTPLITRFFARNADADRQDEFPPVENKRRMVDCADDFTGDFRRLMLMHPGQQNRELIASKARQHTAAIEDVDPDIGEMHNRSA